MADENSFVQKVSFRVDDSEVERAFGKIERRLADLRRRNLGREMSEFGWGAVDEMTLKETLDAKKLQADTLKAYCDMGVLSPDEIREGVFVNGHGWEVSVDGGEPGEG